MLPLMTNLELCYIHSDINAKKIVTGMHELIQETFSIYLSQILQRDLNTKFPDSNLSRQQSMFKYKSYYND